MEKTMKTLIVVFLALLAINLSGCGVWMAERVMNNMTDNTIKLMEAQAKIEREKRKESYTIEGVVATVKMGEKEVQDLDPKNIKKNKRVEGNKVEVQVEPGRKTIKTCIVVFEDGREKEFNSVPSMPLTKGMYYIITYNGMNEITQVQARKHE